MCRIQQTIFTAYIVSNFYLILSKQNQKFTINILISLIFFNIIIVFDVYVLNHGHIIVITLSSQ